MKFFKKISAVFKAYDYTDKVVTALALAVFLLMIAKMMIFPYGFFNFGVSNLYTEGIVSKNGIQNLNPLFVEYNETDRDISRLLFSGLMKYDPEKGAITEDMASLTINELKTEYTFVMKNNLKWSDGEDVTADDVYFTFHDVVLNPNFQNEILKTNFSNVSVEKVDAKTIKFKLQKPNIFFATSLTLGILPKHILKDVDPALLLQNAFNKSPVGTGHYMISDSIESFPDGRMQVTLTKNPYYYVDKSNIENIRFISYPTMDQLVAQMNSVNGVVKITGEYIKKFQGNPRFELIPYELPQYTAVFMNMDKPLIGKNKNVRLALQKAVDKEKLIGEFVDKIPVDTPLMELNQKDWVYQASIQQAEGALKDAGFKYPSGGKVRITDKGEELKLNMIVRLYDDGTYQYEETKKVVSFLKSAWESVGFKIDVQFLAQDAFKSKISSRDYDLVLAGQSLGYNLDTYSYWHSTQGNSNGQNLSNYKSFSVDTLIEDIRSVFDAEKRAVTLKKLAEQIKTDVPAVFLYRPVYYYASDKKISGINMGGLVFPSDRFGRIGLWKFLR
ncbi:peptide ABC transporter substrate-binding protein [Candidatus Peregrinibacteria bacterium]|nr:peptide ABC transporter substrate-binding protein [Candidatus Peregrinibacteria bacterium]